MDRAFNIPTANLVVQIISIALMIIAPLVIAVVARRRLDAGWPIFWMGALVFFVSQMLLRIPLLAALQLALGPQALGSTGMTIAVGALLALTAALFETGGRYVGLRLMRRTPKSWDVGVMFGLGHGAIESAVLVAGIAAAQLATLLTLTSAQVAALPAPQAEAITALGQAVASGPAWLGLAGAWERLVAIAFHVAMSVLVLQTFVRGEWRWAGYALGAHFLMDLIVPTLIPALIPEGAPRIVAQQLALAAALAFAIWLARALRPAPGSGEPAAPERALA